MLITKFFALYIEKLAVCVSGKIFLNLRSENSPCKRTLLLSSVSVFLELNKHTIVLVINVANKMTS